MASHAVWEAVDGPTYPGGYLCVGCLERRLGRELTAADFMDVPLNEPLECDSARLAHRKSRSKRSEGEATC